MPEYTTTDKDKEAIIAFAKAVKEAQDRGQAETPDQRTERFLKKSQEPGHRYVEPPAQEEYKAAPGRYVPPDDSYRNDKPRDPLKSRYSPEQVQAQPKTPDSDYEMDEGNVMTPTAPLSWGNVGERMTEYPSRFVTPQSEDQKASNSLRIMMAKNEAEQLAQRVKAAIQKLRGKL